MRRKKKQFPSTAVLKLVNFLLGKHVRVDQTSLFLLCDWYSRATDQHWVKKDWPAGEDLAISDKNIINEPLVNRDCIILSLLHVKLDLIRW